MTSPATSVHTTVDDNDIVVEASAPPVALLHDAVMIEAAPPDVVNTGQDNHTCQPARSRSRVVGGAAVAGGLVGFALAGPVVGLIAAGGVAVTATTKGTAGEVARATGNVTAAAGERLKKFDNKHHVVQKTSKGVVKGCNWVSKKLAVKKKETN